MSGDDQDESCEGGDCYETAGRYLLEDMGKGDSDLRLVHGLVNGQGSLQGKIFGHAWVENGDNVIDNSNGRSIQMPKSAYYAIGRIKTEDTYTYDRQQAMEQMLRNEHWGPWDMTGETRDASRRTAMSWQDWADEVQSLDAGKTGIYYVNHGGPKSEDSQLAYTVGPDGIDVNGLYTNPEYRQDGVAESFFRRLHDDYPDLKINPGSMTTMGQGFHDRMLDKEPESEDFVIYKEAAFNQEPRQSQLDKLYKEAVFNQDFVNSLRSEFHDWNGSDPNRDNIDNNTIGDWYKVEEFLGERYPASCRGFDTCLEEARPHLRGEELPLGPGPNYGPLNPPPAYETGPEAQTKHGYDPASVAAGMVLLHNQANSLPGSKFLGREDEILEDQDLLNDIFDKRQKMQRDYESRQPVTAFSREAIADDEVVDRPFWPAVQHHEG